MKRATASCCASIPNPLDTLLVRGNPVVGDVFRHGETLSALFSNDRLNEYTHARTSSSPLAAQNFGALLHQRKRRFPSTAGRGRGKIVPRAVNPQDGIQQRQCMRHIAISIEGACAWFVDGIERRGRIRMTRGVRGSAA